MKVTGFSIIRNAILYDYPIIEAIQSIFPLCDEIIVGVGKSEDDTLGLFKNTDPKIHIIETVWDESLRNGKVLAAETNKILREIPEDTDWCFYIQADEIIHEDYHSSIRRAMKDHLEKPDVDGLLFNYLHFFGSYDYIATAPNWYRKEIRIIRNNRSIYSYKDAQGFRKDNNRKLRVKPVDAYVFHYGWVKHPKIQLKKNKDFHRFYTEDEWNDPKLYKAEEFDYSIIDKLEKFEGTHPDVMRERIQKQNWKFDHDISYNRMELKNRFKYFFEKHFGFIPGEYRNYKIV